MRWIYKLHGIRELLDDTEEADESDANINRIKVKIAKILEAFVKNLITPNIRADFIGVAKKFRGIPKSGGNLGRFNRVLDDMYDKCDKWRVWVELEHDSIGGQT